MRSFVSHNWLSGLSARLSAWLRSRQAATVGLAGIGCGLAATAVAAGPAAVPILSLLAILPLEAALTGSRKAMWWATVSSLCVAAASVLLMPIIGSNFGNASTFTTATIIAGLAYLAHFATRLIGRKDASAERERSLIERADLLADHSNEMLMRLNRSGHAAFVSKASVRLSGHEPTSLHGAGLLEAMHVQDRVVFLKAVNDSVASRACVSTKARLRVRGHSDVLWREFAIILHPPIKSRELVAVWHDNTRVGALEDRLDAMDVATLERGESQAKKFAQMSHELRTPLNAIGGFSQLLASGVAGPLTTDKQREYVALIQQSSDHLLQIVGDLLDVSRIDQGHFELDVAAFDFVEMAQSTTAMMQAEAIAADIDLVCDMPKSLAAVVGDRRACQQVLINLLSNAIKFSPAGSSVRLTARRHGRFVKIRCSDFGIGMTREFIDQIGRPFMQAQPASEGGPTGSGLGVSVVKGLVELHGGQIHFDSKPDEGTTVTVMLPFRSASAKPVPADAKTRVLRIGTPRLAASTDEADTNASEIENTGPENTEPENQTSSIQTQGESSARVSA